MTLALASRNAQLRLASIGLTAGVLGLCTCAPGEQVLTDAIPGVLLAGQVTNSGEEPVPHAQVVAWGLAGTACTYPAMVATTSTDTLGHYGLELRGLTRSEFQGCVELRVTPASGSGLAPDTSRVTDVWFRDPPAPDTLHIDVLLRAPSN